MFIEDGSGSQPATSTAKQIEATITIGGTDNKAVFEPAPDDERPKEEKGKDACSHYVAKTPFMKV